MSDSVGQVTELCGMFGIVKCEPPWEATPELLRYLDAHWFFGGYRLKLYPPREDRAPTE